MEAPNEELSNFTEMKVTLEMNSACILDRTDDADAYVTRRLLLPN